jgi:nitric oxide reductase subunit B
MQALPAIILVYSTIKTAQFTTYSSLSARDKITIALIGCSTFYHIFGASILGFFMAYPPINRFIHGTYITSAHSHFALFGVFGFLILAVCFYILFTEVVLSQKMYRFCQMAILALNAGLLTMGIGLLLAGGLQCYFWRVIGLSISETNELIRPYLFIRAFGGGIYATGSMLLTFFVLKSIWPKIREIFRTSGKIASIKYDDLHQLQQLMQELIKKEKEAERLLIKIRKLSQMAETQDKLKH